MITTLPPSRPVTDFMSKNVQTLAADDTLQRAAAMLVKWKVSSAPVVDRGVLVGVISEYDCLDWLARDHFQTLFEGPERQVRDHMTKTLRTVSPEAELQELTHLLLRQRYHRIPVVGADGRLLGMVTRHGLLKAMQSARKLGLSQDRYPDYRRPA